MRQFIASVVVVGGLGCTAEEPTLGSTAGMTFEEFESSAAREPGTNAYVVDWDRVLDTKEQLREFWGELQQGALAVRTSNGVDVRWSTAQQRALTYCIADGFGANKAAVVEAMRQATDESWEKFANLDFIYMPAQDATCNAQNTAVVFDVSPISNAPYIASAFYPDEPREARTVTIDVLDAFPLENGTLRGLLSHELGHTLGFPHEHTRPEAQQDNPDCTSTRPLRALTTYDSASIMHYPQCNGTGPALVFTQRDAEGAAALYGAPLVNVSPMAQVTAPMNGAIVGPTFTVDAEIVDDDIANVELVIDGALREAKTAAPFQFIVTELAEGPHTLEIKATDSIGQIDTQTIAITVIAAGGGNGDGDGDGDGDDGAINGGCDAGGTPRDLLVPGLLLVVIGRRRRSR